MILPPIQQVWSPGITNKYDFEDFESEPTLH